MNRPQLLVVDERERQRLQELQRYNVLDTTPEPCYDEIAQLAAHICQVPVALVVFVDACRLFLKARLGMEGVTEIPIVDREQLFCVHAIMDDSLLVIPDALEDARFRCNPMVVNEPKIRFYAGAPLVSPAGHRLGNLCVIDMVPRHLDAQQKRSLEQLSRQVSAQLELRLSLAAVCQQNRQLEKLSAEKSRFLSAVSHDIRQPLATVMMCSELMLNDDELLAEPHVELANASFTCAQFMHNLVDELLQMGESDFGNVPVPLDCRMTDLVALVHRVVASNALYARPKHITLHLAIEAGGGGGGGGGPCASPSPVSRRPEPGALVLAAPASSGGGGTRELLSYDQWHASRVGARGKINLFIDPMKIEQVLNNLLSNAVKFSRPHSSIDVVIGRVDMGGHVEGSRVQGRCASVSVMDRGQGIPREEMGKLFQPFQRLSVKPTGGETSTGLGLAITRNIVLAHAGDVQVESEQGRGSTFRMLLPLPTRSDLIEPLAGNAPSRWQLVFTSLVIHLAPSFVVSHARCRVVSCLVSCRCSCRVVRNGRTAAAAAPTERPGGHSAAARQDGVQRAGGGRQRHQPEPHDADPAAARPRGVDGKRRRGGAGAVPRDGRARALPPPADRRGDAADVRRGDDRAHPQARGRAGGEQGEVAAHAAGVGDRPRRQRAQEGDPGGRRRRCLPQAVQRRQAAPDRGAVGRPLPPPPAAAAEADLWDRPPKLTLVRVTKVIIYEK